MFTSHAKMRCFRNSLGVIVWILEHPLIANELASKGLPSGMRDWRNYDLAKLADDFRREAPVLAREYQKRKAALSAPANSSLRSLWKRLRS